MRPKRKVVYTQDRQAEVATNSLIDDIYIELTKISAKLAELESSISDSPPPQAMRITEDQLQFSDIIIRDVSTLLHGLIPKAPNDISLFFRGDGVWASLAIIKTTTGDSPLTLEGLIVINTFDNAIKMYADAAWRTLVSW